MIWVIYRHALALGGGVRRGETATPIAYTDRPAKTMIGGRPGRPEIQSAPENGCDVLSEAMAIGAKRSRTAR
ncbi:MAG TPA: hypothetical protein PLH31_08890 [Caulobacter sp.]|nr:hypothetical protein [Caulobacter sp.]